MVTSAPTPGNLSHPDAVNAEMKDKDTKPCAISVTHSAMAKRHLNGVEKWSGSEVCRIPGPSFDHEAVKKCSNVLVRRVISCPIQ